MAIILAGAIVAASLYFRHSRLTPSPTPEPSPSTRASVLGEAVAAEVAVAESDPTLGPADAPVTLIEFSDFECPYCREFHATTFSVLKQYAAEGRVRVVLKDFPLSQIHSRAQAAAEAAQCAHRQGKFWEYSDELFKPDAALDDSSLRAIAPRLGLNPTIFNQCLTHHETAALVAEDAQAAVAAGITGTPAFVINGLMIEGALPEDLLRQVIEEQSQ